MGWQVNIPIFAMILVATLVSTASSMGGGLILYFQGLESLEDSMSDTSAGELRSLRETIQKQLTNVETGIDSLRRFVFSTERLRPGSLSTEWADTVRAYAYAQVAGSAGSIYGIGMYAPPHDWAVNNGFAVISYEEAQGKTRTGAGDMRMGEVHEQLPKNHTILTPDGQLANVLAPIYALDANTGYKTKRLYNVPAGWIFKMPDPRLPQDGPYAFMERPVASSVMSYWAPPAQWVSSKGVRYWQTYLRAIYMPPPPPHPLHRFKTVCLTLGIDFAIFQPPFDDYKQAHPDTVVLMADRQTGIVQASTILPMVPSWCQVGGGIGDYIPQGCALRLTNLSQAVQSGFQKSGEEPFGSFMKAELDGEDYFIRRLNLGFQNLELVWMRPTSSVQGKVQEALVLLILFTVLVLCFDVTIMVMEVVFIAMPMRQLSSAIMSVGNMETEDANQYISMYRQRAVMLKEMRGLMEGMTATIGRLEEFRTFMPEAIFASEPVLVGSQQQEAPGRETGHAAVLFTDVQGSTQLWEGYTEEMAEALRLHNTVIREAIEEHGGYEVKTIGDAFMVSFPDIGTAVRFGLRTQERLFQAAWPAELLEVVQAPGDEGRGLRGLRVRMGVTHGAVNVDLNEVARRCDYFGPTVNRAARLEANGVCGGVAVEASVVDSLTAVQQQQALVVQLGTRSLKGIGDIPLCLLVPQSMPQRAAHVHDADVPNPLQVRRFSGGSTSIGSRESHSTQGMNKLLAVERFGSDKLSDVGSATTGYVDCDVVDLACAEVTAMADRNLRGVVTCLGRSDGRLLNVCGTAVLVAWNVMAPCAGHLEAALRFASMMSGRGVHCGLSSGKVFSGYIATGRNRFVTAVGQCVQISQRVHNMALQTEQAALFATKDTQVTGAMVTHGLATAAGELRKGAEVYTVCVLLCNVVASRVDRKQGLFNSASAAKEDPDN